MDGIRVGKIQHSTFNIQHYNKRLWIYEITQHSTSSIHRPERMLAHPARFLLGLPQISQICTDTLVASNGLIHIKSHSKENL